MNYVILIPVFNDWDCLDLLIPEIDKQLKNSKEEVQVLIINDGSKDKSKSIAATEETNIPLKVQRTKLIHLDSH